MFRELRVHHSNIIAGALLELGYVLPSLEDGTVLCQGKSRMIEQEFSLFMGAGIVPQALLFVCPCRVIGHCEHGRSTADADSSILGYCSV